MRECSFSLKRFLGITQIKQQIARQTGLLNTRNGMESWGCGEEKDLEEGNF